MVFDLGSDMACEGHKVLDHHADNVEAIGNDLGIWKPFADERTVRTRKVDAHEANPIAAMEAIKERGHVVS